MRLVKLNELFRATRNGDKNKTAVAPRSKFRYQDTSTRTCYNTCMHMYVYRRIRVISRVRNLNVKREIIRRFSFNVCLSNSREYSLIRR